MISAIVLAGGMGARMGGSVSKQYMELCERPLLYYSIEAFDSHPEVGEIIVVIRKGEEELFEREVFSKYMFRKNIKITRGGEERSDSVRNGLSLLDRKSEIVMIHDGVRPFVDARIIDENIALCRAGKPCITGVATKDTVKIVDSSMEIVETPDRNRVFLAQTPQTFPKDMIIKAFESNELKGKKLTDDSMAVELLGEKVKVVKGDYENIKITTPEDMAVATEIAKKRGL